MIEKNFKKFFIDYNANTIDALKKINKLGGQSLIVTAKKNILVGILSSADIRKAIMSHNITNKNISKIYNRKPKFIYFDELQKKIKNIIYNISKLNIIPIIDRKTKKIVDVLNSEKKLKLSNEQTFKNFINNINKSKNKLYAFLKRANKLGKTIHGYGASTKGNVLLQYYNINNKMIDYVAERNKNKFNLYTPGTNIKIISESKSRIYNPDYYLVLPWHFKKEILVREKKIRKKGTKFIFPLPKLKII
jgi:hypothetical protein